MFSDKTKRYKLSDSRQSFLASFAQDGELVIRLGFGEVLFVRAGSSVYAFRNKCPHQNKPLNGCTIWEGSVICPWHKYQFNLENGRGHGLYLETYPLLETEEGFFLERTYFSWFGE